MSPVRRLHTSHSLFEHELRLAADDPRDERHGRLAGMRRAQVAKRAGRENPEARVDRIAIYGADGKLVFEAKLGDVRR